MCVCIYFMHINRTEIGALALFEMSLLELLLGNILIFAHSHVHTSLPLGKFTSHFTRYSVPYKTTNSIEAFASLLMNHIGHTLEFYNAMKRWRVSSESIFTVEHLHSIKQ